IVRKRQRQGKGGPKVETEHVYRTYAIGVCEGPITRFVRIWRNNTLVFDVSEFPQKTHEENVEFLKHARFFLGTWDQNPSPALEKIFGVGTTPSHRGTAYMVMEDEERTDLRGAIPQWMFQVERCEGFFVTSRPYALEAEDGARLDQIRAPRPGWQWNDPPPDSVDLPPLTPLGGTLSGGGVTYGDWPAEAAELMQVEPLGGTIFGSGAVYDAWPEEAAEVAQIEPLGGTIFGDSVEYANWPEEAAELAALTPLGGTLT